MPNGNCPIGAAHAQQIRLLEESIERVDACLGRKAETSSLERVEEKVDKISNMLWALVTLIIANLAGIILVLIQ
ncbi:hypothetical protein HZA56_13740 [Candidatus Poribacteria bacterium]|nr:hypothetical protein [Candidatus Poribacteria bacterium]